MSRKVRFWGGLGVLGFLLLGSYWLFGAKAAPDIQVRASFRSLVNPAYPPGTPEYYADKILNDAGGPYVTTSNNNISVVITPELGNLKFVIEHHSGRGPLIIFPISATPCGYLPDTAGIYSGLPDEPVDYLWIFTGNEHYFAGPKLNLLTMPISTPDQPLPQQIRLWMWMCTERTHGYKIKYNAPETADSGVVEVIAFDRDANGKPDHWEFSPVPGSNDLAWIKIYPRGNTDPCQWGGFSMPFKLILERL